MTLIMLSYNCLLDDKCDSFEIYFCHILKYSKVNIVFINVLSVKMLHYF